MKKVIIVANQCTDIPFYEDCDYIGVDKGALACLNNKILMKYAIGDFDSISKEHYDALVKQCQVISLPCKKNQTDGEYSIRFAYECGYDEIFVYGVTGGRLDHFLTIFKLLQYDNINFKIIDAQNCIYALNKGTYTIPKTSKYISIFPCEPLMISLDGVAYPLHQVSISPKDLYLVSNEIIEEAHLQISGKIIIIESNDKKDVSI